MQATAEVMATGRSYLGVLKATNGERLGQLDKTMSLALEAMDDCCRASDEEAKAEEKRSKTAAAACHGHPAREGAW